MTTDGRISLVSGREAECNCLDAACPCYDPDHFLASNVLFSAISAITVTPDSVLTIADQGNYRLRSLSSGLPPEKADGVFEVPDSEAQESYIFNKFGQHVITKVRISQTIKERRFHERDLRAAHIFNHERKKSAAHSIS